MPERTKGLDLFPQVDRAAFDRLSTPQKFQLIAELTRRALQPNKPEAIRRPEYPQGTFLEAEVSFDRNSGEENWRLFDETYSIDGPQGQFLGECGVSYMALKEPKDQDALEVWVFDKSDIQTHTAEIVLPSSVSKKIAPQGGQKISLVVPAQAGATGSLETASLVLDFTVTRAVADKQIDTLSLKLVAHDKQERN